MNRNVTHVGLDVDGVLRDLPAKVIAVFERERPLFAGQQQKLEAWSEWGQFHRYFPPDSDFYPLIRLFQQEIWEEAAVYPDVQPMLTSLASRYTLHIVTAQPTSTAAAYTQAWLVRNQIPVPPDRVHILTDKSLAPVDVLIDDVPDHLHAVSRVGITAICRSRPWNQSWTGRRISDLGELSTMLEALQVTP